MSDPFVTIAAWTTQSGLTRYPTAGTYDVSAFGYLAGEIGLNPEGETSHGVVTFFWTADPAGQTIVGVQGLNLTSLIVSLNQLSLPNLGPYLYFTYQPCLGSNPLAVTLSGSNTPRGELEWAGDTILIDAANQSLAAQASATIYPDDYFAGSVRILLDAPAGVALALYGADLLDAFWKLDEVTPGSVTTVVPLGTWCAVVSNPTANAVTYGLTVTPLLA